MIWHALRKAVHGMEGMTSVRCRHDPFVVWLMECLINPRMMQPSMNPINTEIGEADEQWELYVVVNTERCIGGRIVQFSVASNFGEETWSGEDSHDGHGDHGLCDFESHLVFEVFWVGERRVIEYEKIGERGADEIDNQAEDPGRCQNACSI